MRSEIVEERVSKPKTAVNWISVWPSAYSISVYRDFKKAIEIPEINLSNRKVLQHSCSVIILQAFKTELDLNNKQRSACARPAGTGRFAYNWGLERKIAAYQAKEKTPSAIDLHRKLNRLKKTELSWM